MRWRAWAHLAAALMPIKRPTAAAPRAAAPPPLLSASCAASGAYMCVVAAVPLCGIYSGCAAQLPRRCTFCGAAEHRATQPLQKRRSYTQQPRTRSAATKYTAAATTHLYILYLHIYFIRLPSFFLHSPHGSAGRRRRRFAEPQPIFALNIDTTWAMWLLLHALRKIKSGCQKPCSPTGAHVQALPGFAA